jgi:hypothetical protein
MSPPSSVSKNKPSKTCVHEACTLWLVTITSVTSVTACVLFLISTYTATVCLMCSFPVRCKRWSAGDHILFDKLWLKNTVWSSVLELNERQYIALINFRKAKT